MGNLGSTLLRDDTKTGLRETIFFWYVLEGPVSFFSERRKEFQGRVSTKKEEEKRFLKNLFFLIKGTL